MAAPSEQPQPDPAPQSELITLLTSFFATRPDVLFAVLFGSAAAGRAHSESDVDIAVYFEDGRPDVSVERPRTFSGEETLWAELERLCGRPVDLVVLNRAPATVGGGALVTGTPVANRDQRKFTDYLLLATSVAEEERAFTDDYIAIKKRSRSLSEIDRTRLVRILDFLEDELEDANEFAELSLERYATDRGFRRSLERWIENLVNASIDIAKIILASERRSIPQTYRETIEHLPTVGAFKQSTALCAKLAGNTQVRNMLAHEYLDLRFSRISAVAKDAEETYRSLALGVRAWMSQEI
jgi:predicted nucleotidyltransferase/uncharacterized protein YutE (UPF0331/DUF86 family)